MNEAALARLLRGKFSYLRADPEDVRGTIPDWEEALPIPQRIFLAQEEATPIQGFPILLTDSLTDLREALTGYVEAEEEFEIDSIRGRAPTRNRADAGWDRYSRLLETATENAASSSFGRLFPSIFWLYHSVAVARVLKECPRRVRRSDLEVGKSHGDAIKYLVFNRYLDKVLTVTYEVAQRVAEATEEPEKEHFPSLLTRMRDNVLILTEDHISPDLGELGAFFRGCLRMDGKEFRERIHRLVEWHDEQLESEVFRSAIGRLLGVESHSESRQYLARPGYVSYLATTRSYDENALLPTAWIKVWETLVGRVKEFELLAALRRLVVPIDEVGGRLTCSAVAAGRAATHRGAVELSDSTRPMDFMTPWVVDPLVQRFGLIYDITQFSAIVSALRRSGNQTQDDSIRQIFRFQRRVNRMTQSHRLKLEKYLGDGALYSGRFPTRLLAAAVHLQRSYRQARAEGFPFDRGMRIALNYGKYRLLPIEAGGTEHRYEFFGHGIVELSRLVTGKTSQEIEDVKTALLSRGYNAADVERFFAPVARESVQLADKVEETREFYAYVNSSGVLSNEGIVATGRFVDHLARSDAAQTLYRVVEDRRRYVALTCDEGSGPITVGIRKLGAAQLKGLGALPVYEVIDGDAWVVGEELEELTGTTLLEAVEKDFETATGADSRRSELGPGGDALGRREPH